MIVLSNLWSIAPDGKRIPSGPIGSVKGNQTKKVIFSGPGIVTVIAPVNDVPGSYFILYDSADNVLFESDAGVLSDALGGFLRGGIAIEFPNGLKITSVGFSDASGDGLLWVVYAQ